MKKATIKRLGKKAAKMVALSAASYMVFSITGVYVPPIAVIAGKKISIKTVRLVRKIVVKH